MFRCLVVLATSLLPVVFGDIVDSRSVVLVNGRRDRRSVVADMVGARCFRRDQCQSSFAPLLQGANAAGQQSCRLPKERELFAGSSFGGRA